MLVAATVGTAVGAVAGYFRRWVDTALMRLVDVGLAMPRIFVLLMAVALWEHIGLWVLVLLIGLTGWFGTSRLVRAEVLSLREREFVAAARALARARGGHLSPRSSQCGGSDHRLRGPRHRPHDAARGGALVPRLGVPSPTPSWGNMIADGWHKMAVAWWSSTFPGLRSRSS